MAQSSPKKKVLERIDEIMGLLRLLREAAELIDAGVCVEITLDGENGVKAGFIGDCLVIDIEPLGITYDGVLRLLRAVERMGVRLPYSAEDVACAIAAVEGEFKLGAMKCRIQSEELRSVIEKAANAYKEREWLWR